MTFEIMSRRTAAFTLERLNIEVPLKRLGLLKTKTPQPKPSRTGAPQQVLDTGNPIVYLSNHRSPVAEGRPFCSLCRQWRRGGAGLYFGVRSTCRWQLMRLRLICDGRHICYVHDCFRLSLCSFPSPTVEYSHHGT